MFLYTICPRCQAGYDVTALLRGKKMRCKGCAQPFTVSAGPRPGHLPAPAAFQRPHTSAPVQEFAAKPLPALAQARSIVDVARIVNPGRTFGRSPSPPLRPAPVANSGSSWAGRGGASAGIFLVLLLIRGCLAVTSSRTSYTPSSYTPPPVVMPQQPQWNPNNNNQWKPHNNPQWGPNNDPNWVPNNNPQWKPNNINPGQPKFGKNGWNIPKGEGGAQPPVDDGQPKQPSPRRSGHVPPPLPEPDMKPSRRDD